MHLQILVDKCRNLLLILLLLKNNLRREFPCLLNLPLTNLEWPSSVFNISLSSEEGPVLDHTLEASKGVAT